MNRLKNWIFCLICFIGIFKNGSAQFYYNDILSNQETNLLNQKMKKAKVISVNVISLDFDNTPVENFLCEQIIENNAKHTFTITGSPIVGENHLHAWFSNQSQITRTIDSIPTRLEEDNYLIAQNNYFYSGNALNKITITTFETNNSKEKVIETHQWFYENNLPGKAWIIKGANDSSTVLLKADSLTQLITEEVVWYKGKEKDRYYYYYDSLKRLTDIVRYHPFLKKLLPQYVFEYNNENQVFKMTNFTSGTKDYLIWFYKYDEYGLKSEEQCYAKGNLFKGRLVYKYQYD